MEVNLCFTHIFQSFTLGRCPYRYTIFTCTYHLNLGPPPLHSWLSWHPYPTPNIGTMVEKWHPTSLVVVVVLIANTVAIQYGLSSLVRHILLDYCALLYCQDVMFACVPWVLFKLWQHGIATCYLTLGIIYWIFIGILLLLQCILGPHCCASILIPISELTPILIVWQDDSTNNYYNIHALVQ